VISKDEVRAALFPERLIDYSAAQDDLCMDAAIRAAQYLATRQRVPYIFLDGRTFSRAYQIDAVITAANACGARWKILHLFCPDKIARQRLEQGRIENHVARNRDFKLYLELQACFEPITRPNLHVDTSRSLEESVEQSRVYLMD
jgi:predicted kinase